MDPVSFVQSLKLANEETALPTEMFLAVSDDNKGKRGIKDKKAQGFVNRAQKTSQYLPDLNYGSGEKFSFGKSRVHLISVHQIS